MLVAFSDLLLGGRKVAVKRAHARWSRLREKNFRLQSEDFVAVKRAHVGWSR